MSPARAVVALAAVLFLCNLQGYDLWAPDEPYFAEGAREMIDSGALDGVGAILANHMDPSRRVGRIGLRNGVLTARRLQ